jgi:hypothetical protein
MVAIRMLVCSYVRILQLGRSQIQVDDEFHFEAWDKERKSELGTLTACFADFLVEKFFLPRK